MYHDLNVNLVPTKVPKFGGMTKYCKNLRFGKIWDMCQTSAYGIDVLSTQKYTYFDCSNTKSENCASFLKPIFLGHTKHTF